jgi:hypothetical protein
VVRCKGIASALLKKRHLLADTGNRDKKNKTRPQEEGRVQTKNRESRRRWKEEQAADVKKFDAGMLPASTCKVWNTIKHFHPYKKEILDVVRMLNSIGVNRNIIAAALGLKRWNTFYSGGEWTDEDIKDILQEYRGG